MRLLSVNPQMSQRDLANELGVSLGAVNYCIRALVAMGDVKIRNFRANDNKLRYAYILTPKGLRRKTRLTASFLQRKLKEYHALQSEINALRQELSDDTESS